MTKDLINKDQTLPTTAEELQKFIMVGNEALKAEEAKLKAINDAELGQEVYLKYLYQAQEKARIVIEAIIRTGELLTLENKKTHQKPKFLEGPSGGTLEIGGDKALKGSESTLPENITKDLSHRYQIIFRNKEKVVFYL